MVASYVWDFDRNAWHNYYNHGIEVVGESLNPPTVEYVVDRFGNTHALTIKEVSEGKRLDENNSLWILVGDEWQPYNGNYAQIHPESVQESWKTPSVITRDWGSFQLLKEHEALRAEEKLNEILGIHKSLNPYLKDVG